jgi:hypothetical protein
MTGPQPTITSAFFKVTLDQKRESIRAQGGIPSADGRQGGPVARNFKGVTE